jgi:hypothetical protein
MDKLSILIYNSRELYDINHYQGYILALINTFYALWDTFYAKMLIFYSIYCF